MDVLCSTAMRTRVDTGKKRVFHAFSWPAAARRASCLTRKLPWPSSSCVGLRELSPQVGLLKNECPERDASDPLCPAWQEQIMPGPIYKDVCPRLPAAQPFDPGDGEDAEAAVGKSVG